MAQLSRRQFLRGDVRGERAAIRPPWALPEPAFAEVCTACGECLRHCPQQILRAGSLGYPQVDFQRGECTFCADCVRVCRPHALLEHDLATNARPWAITAHIDATCLPLTGVVCGTCAEHCEVAAIQMRPRIGGVSVPVVNSENCTGCGACVRICPAQAIKII